VVDRRHIAGIAQRLGHVGGAGDKYGVLKAHDRLLLDVVGTLGRFPEEGYFFEKVFHLGTLEKSTLLPMLCVFHIVNLNFIMSKGIADGAEKYAESSQ
jgi:hypothetical protein